MEGDYGLPDSLQQTKRLYALLQVLKDHRLGLKLAEIRTLLKGKSLDVSERTIKRDLDALAKIGYPTTKDQAKASYQLEEAVEVRRYFTLSTSDLLGLHLAKSLLKPLQQSPLHGHMEGFFQKVESLIGSSARAFLGEMKGIYKVDAHSHWGQGVNPDVLSVLQHACQERLKVDIVYDTPNNSNKSKRRIGPQFLYLSRGSLYLIAEDMASGILKTFQVWGISSVEITKFPYHGTIVEAEEFFKNAIGLYRGKDAVLVRLRVARELAGFALGRSFHPTQKNLRKGDGSLDIEMRTAITPELIQVLLSFGKHLEVLEPEELRQNLKEEAERIAALYP